MNKPGTEEQMQVPEVARYLDINEKKVYFLAKVGKIPFARVTGKWTFPKALIDRWVEESASGRVGQPGKNEGRAFILCAGSDDPTLRIPSDLYAARTRPALALAARGDSDVALVSLRVSKKNTSPKANFSIVDR